MGFIGDVFVDQAMTEQLVAIINVRYMKVKAVESKTRHFIITPKEVSRKLNIRVEKSKDTLRVTTQNWIRHAVHPFHRRYIVDNIQLDRKRLNMKFYNEHLLAKTNYL